MECLDFDFHIGHWILRPSNNGLWKPSSSRRIVDSWLACGNTAPTTYPVTHCSEGAHLLPGNGTWNGQYCVCWSHPWSQVLWCSCHWHDGILTIFTSQLTYSFKFFNVTGYSIGIGLCSALDTLCAQAHGSKNSMLMGIYVQQGSQFPVSLLAQLLSPAMVLLAVVLTPIFFLNWNAGEVLIWMGQVHTFKRRSRHFLPLTAVTHSRKMCPY